MVHEKVIHLPGTYNYIAAFLTFRCCYACSYCINRFGDFQMKRDEISGDQWIFFLNRLKTHVPVTLQGGEPSLHRDFYDIITKTSADIKLDILTNLSFDIDEFIRRVPPERLNRDAPYAPIRVSYHPEVMDLDTTIAKVLKVQNAGFRIGLYGVMHPKQEKIIKDAMEKCRALGIDFRTKEYLGMYDGKMFGLYKYDGACERLWKKKVRCKTTELIIGPEGNIFRCHTDIYDQKAPVGTITSDTVEIKDMFRPCDYFGCCNPCDVKIKNNRFQQFGHTSVEIIPG